MRRYKREGRRILTRFLGPWDESPIGEHSTGLGICVIVAVPGRIGADAPCLPSGVLIY